MSNKDIKRATIGRLPQYLRYITALPQEITTVSATGIAKALELGEVQVRKDLGAVCGAGRPRALLDYAGFSEYGTNILAAFDLHLPAGGDRSEQKPVYPMSMLADFCTANHVSIGIVTVPKEAAQAVTDVLYRSGVRAFWCFAPCRLQLPPDAVIQYENLALSLAHLKARL